MQFNNEITCMFPLPYQGDAYPGVVFRANVVNEEARFVVTPNKELLRCTETGVTRFPYSGELHMYATVYYRSNTHEYLGTAPTIKHGDYRMEACVNGKWVPAYLKVIGFMLIFRDGNLVNYRMK